MSPRGAPGDDALRESPLRQALKRGLELALPRDRFVVRGPAASPSVALTFDDGPHPDETPRVLDALGELAVSATFFVVGERAERHPDLVRRMAREGHLVGSHSYSHAPPASTSAASLVGEARRTAALLLELTGSPCTLFRPPLGKLTASKLVGLLAEGQTIALWSVDPRDYSARSVDEVRGAFERRPLVAGDVVLLHDVRPLAREVLPWLVPATRARGLGFARLDRWLTRGARAR